MYREGLRCDLAPVCNECSFSEKVLYCFHGGTVYML